jgi:hypothetical protein
MDDRRMSERRQSTRQKSLLRGCIYFNNRLSSTDCLIRDISTTGARLIFSEAVSIPDKIDLYIAQKEQTLCAYVQWRRGDEVGVAFAEPAADKAKPDDELSERVAKLEAEIATLRKMLKRLKSEVTGTAEEAA